MTAAQWKGPARGRRWLGVAAALLVQGVAVSVLWMDHGWRHPGRREPPRLTEVRLLPLAAERQPAPAAPAARLDPRPERPRVPAPIVVAVPEVQVTATPPTSAIQTVAAPAVPAPAASAPPGDGRSRLNLALPKGGGAADPRLRMADQVRNDPRSHSERRTIESAIADAAGTLPIVTSTSTSGSGSKIVRQGSKCTRVYENRVAELNPTDDRLKGAPMLAGGCFSK